ncbi:SUMF1/EgtB/PvdO family nonheme iron enzyme [Endothiovibrio diazotrophicus]
MRDRRAVPRRSAVSRADLLECLAELGEAALVGAAPLFGFVHREAASVAAVQPATVVSAPRPSSSPSERKPPDKPVTPSSERFLYVRDRQRLEPDAGAQEAPAWVRESGILQEEPAGRPAPPPPRPLARWARLWPFLKTVLGEEAERGEVDLPRLVARLAEGRPCPRLPRRRRAGWAPRVQLVFDLDPGLLPYWEDFHDLHQRLQRLYGRAGLEVVVLRDGPEGRAWRLGDREPVPRAYHPPPPATPLLLLSDLGGLTGRQRADAWQRLGRRLSGAGIAPVALLPCAEAHWPAHAERGFRCARWGWEARPSIRREASRRSPPAEAAVESLLALAASAVRLEPALMRELRHLLPGLDAGVEARLWSHPHVVAGLTAAALREEWVGYYQERFRALPEGLKAAAAAAITRHHRHLPESLRAVEGLILGDLLERPAEAAEAFLRRAVATLVSPGAYRYREGIAPWGRRMVARLGSGVYRRSEGCAALWAELHREALMGEALVGEGGVALPAGFPLERVGWLLGGGGAERRLALLQRGAALELAAAEPDGREASAAPLARIASGSAWLRVEAEGGAERLVTFREGVRLPLPEGGLRLRSDREAVELGWMAPPPWAEAMGRDGRGLFAELADGRRIHWPERPAWADAAGWDAFGVWAEFAVEGVCQRMRWIEPGRFWMGSPEEEWGRSGDERRHEVTLSEGFWLADTACTQALWRAVTGEDPSLFKGAERPVEQVSWEDVQRFIARLDALRPGLALRLPTEAEWEYACRAGRETPFWFGEAITPEQVNYDGNYPYRSWEKGIYRRETVEVKALPCNGWGLHQMHGNVWEWCADRYGDYPAGPVTDPTGPQAGAMRVIRGGSWGGLARNVRAACRSRDGPGDRDVILGFRCARVQA